MHNNEMVNFITEEVKDILSKYRGFKADDSTNHRIKGDILNYLNMITQKMNYNNIPHVIVENEGPFVTVNFQDYQGNRLETVGDVIYFMGKTKSMVL